MWEGRGNPGVIFIRAGIFVLENIGRKKKPRQIWARPSKEASQLTVLSVWRAQSEKIAPQSHFRSDFSSCDGIIAETRLTLFKRHVGCWLAGSVLIFQMNETVETVRLPQPCSLWSHKHGSGCSSRSAWLCPYIVKLDSSTAAVSYWLHAAMPCVQTKQIPRHSETFGQFYCIRLSIWSTECTVWLGQGCLVCDGR